MRRGSSGHVLKGLALCWLNAVAAVAVCAAPLDDRLDTYLAQHDLLTLRANTLERRLVGVPLAERGAILLELAATYEELLKTLPVAQQASVRERCRALLRENPRPELDAIRVDLLKSEYLEAETVAERSLLRTSAESDSGPTVTTLKRLAAEFNEIAQQASARVRQLEGQEQSRTDATAAEATETKSLLADARRIRSVARYYSGWSACFVAQLLKDRGYANEALLQFGALLNAVERRTPTLERLPRSLLVHEHVARAALGAAACYSIAGNDSEAMRWLDELATAEGLPKVVSDQVLSRRIGILAAGGRWSELSRWVERARAPQGRTTTALEAGDALRLAVATLEGSDGTEKQGAETRLELTRLALGDLISRGQTSAVVALAKRFGTGVLASNGFVAQYVRALQAYDNARSKHAAAGTATTEPARDAAARTAYREAAELFAAAIKSEDSARFAKDVVGAGQSAALAWYYAGDLMKSADQFESVAKVAPKESRQSLLWSALVALDRAVETGEARARERRDELAGLFVAEFPMTEQAAKLLLRRAGSGKVAERQVVATLLAVPSDSPIRTEARWLAASMMFKMARSAKRAEADELIGQFLKIADEIYPTQRDLAVSASGDRRRALADRALLLLRQQAEVALGLSSPDSGRTLRALQEIRKVAELCDAPIDAIAEEMRYRELQVALVEKSTSAIESLATAFAESKTPFADSARELVLRHFIELSRASPTDAKLAAMVLKHGEAVVAAIDVKGVRTAAANVLRDEVAGAAWSVFRATGSVEARDAALRIDKAMYQRGERFTSSVRRLGELSEHAGDSSLALECWTTLAGGLPDTGASWFEASYHSIRLLTLSDVKRARDAMKLLELSHPGLGPEPWASKLRELKLQLFPAPVFPASKAATDGGSGGKP